MAATKKTSAAKKKPAGKQKKKPELSKQERSAAVVAQLKARYKGRIFLGKEYTSPWLLKRLPTGILELDIALNGGFPAGGFVMLYGPEGVGKNYLANRVAAHQQMFYGNQCSIAIVSTEMVYDKTFGKACDMQIGFSEDEIAALDQSYFEATKEHLTEEYKEELRLEIGTVVTVPPTIAEESFDIVLDLVRSREFDVVILDSFGSLLPEEDLDKDMQDRVKVGGASALNTRFARKLSNAFAPDEDGRPNMTCLIGINQVRDNMNRKNPNSPMTIETGGWAIKHFRWVGIELKKNGKVRVGAKKKLAGKVVRWEVTKQKAGGYEGATGTYDFLYSRIGVDRTKESLRTAVSYGIVKQKGSYFSYDGDSIGQGLENAARYIDDNGLLAEIEASILEAAGVQCNYLYWPDGEPEE